METRKGIAELYEEKMNAALDRDTDPREVGEFSLAQLLGLLAEVCLEEAGIAVDRDHAAAQVSRFGRTADRLLRQATQAVSEGREDLAGQALAQRAAIKNGLPGLKDQVAALRAHEDGLLAAESGIRHKVEWFRAQQETIVEQHDLARAQACVASTFASIQGEITHANITAHLAEDCVKDLQARVSALDDPPAPGCSGGHCAGEELQTALDDISTAAAVKEELARIKEQLAGNG